MLLAGNRMFPAPNISELNGAACREKEGAQGLGTGGGCRNSLFCMAEVIAEVEVAGGLWDRRGVVRDADVLQVQEPQFEFH